MVLKILEYPDPRLRKTAAPVPAVTLEIRKLVTDLTETLYAAPGVGLAATDQIRQQFGLQPQEVARSTAAPRPIPSPAPATALDPRG